MSHSIVNEPKVTFSMAPGEVIMRKKAHEIGGADCAFNPLGGTVASAGLDGNVGIWNVIGGYDDFKRIKVSQSALSCVSFNREGTLVGTGDSASGIQLLNIKNGLNVKARISGGHSDCIN